MDLRSAAKPSNKITEIVRLRQMLKKWKKLAVTPKPMALTDSSTTITPPTAGSTATKAAKPKGFLKRTLSFTDPSEANSVPPKGYLAVSVGEGMRRYVIPTEYLAHGAFAALLRQAEEEFGFQQEGVLRIPCSVDVFEDILRVVEGKKKSGGKGAAAVDGCGRQYCSEAADVSRPHRPPHHNKPICR